MPRQKREKIAMNCPELYEIERLYNAGYGCRLIADRLDREESYIDKVLRGQYDRHRAIIGRLSRGKRPASKLARSWQIRR